MIHYKQFIDKIFDIPEDLSLQYLPLSSIFNTSLLSPNYSACQVILSTPANTNARNMH